MGGAAWKRRAVPGACLVLLAVAGCTSHGRAGAPQPKLVIASAEPADPEEAAAPREREPSPALEPLAGRWEGMGVQDDNQSWKMVVEVSSTRNGRCASVEYPSIPCSADWICTDRDADGTLRAREELTSGQDRCIDGGSMTLRSTRPGEIEWSWVGSGVSARATLVRVGGR